MSERTYGIDYQVDWQNPPDWERCRELGLELSIAGQVTPAQFAELFGADKDMVSALCYEVEGPDSWTIHVGISDVLSVESSYRSMQTATINAFRQLEGLPILTPLEAAKEARSELSLPAGDFLLWLYEFGTDISDYEMPDSQRWLVEQAQSQDLSVDDFWDGGV